MFGLGFGEVVVLLVVAIVVVGPRNLPSLLRTAGRWVGQLRRMAADLRDQSGIDELIRNEGLERELRELRELRDLSRGRMLDALVPVDAAPTEFVADEPLREREYPLVGCDSYGALPDDAAPYAPAEPTTSAPEEARGAHAAPEGPR